MDLEQKLATLSPSEMKDQLGIIYLCPISCLIVFGHTGSLPTPGWYRETLVMEGGSEWEGPFDTAQEALAYNAKH